MDIPVLSFWGEKDIIISREVAEEAVKSLPNAELRILSDCGHSPLVDRLNDVVDAISRFIEGLYHN